MLTFGGLEGLAPADKRLASMAGLWVVGVPRMGVVAQLEDHSMAKSKSRKVKAPIRKTRSNSVVRSRGRIKPAGAKTKQQICLDLLNRREGTTVEELQAATGWQQHSVRGFLGR
jgi:hypothetical protein